MGRAEESVSHYLDLQSTNNVKARINHRIKVSSGGEFYFSREIASQARKKYQNTVSLHRISRKKTKYPHYFFLVWCYNISFDVIFFCRYCSVQWNIMRKNLCST